MKTLLQIDFKKIKSFLDHNKIDILFIIFLTFSTTLNTLWIIQDNYLPRGDGRDFILEALDMNRNLKSFEDLKTKLKRPYNYESPLMAFIFLGFYKVFGVMTKKELILNSLFLIVLLFSTYKLSEFIYDKKTALFSIIILNSFVLVVALSKRTVREFHFLAFFTLSFWLMLKTNFFQNRNYSMLFAIILSLTINIIYHFPLYLFLPVSIYGIYSIRRYIYPELKKKRFKVWLSQRFINFALCLLIILVLGGYWYFLNFSSLLNYIKERFKGQILSPKLTTFNMLFYYLRTLFYEGLGFFYAIFLIIALILKVVKKPNFYEKLLLICFIFPNLIFLLFPDRDPSLLLPTYFVAAILISNMLLNIKIKAIKYIVITYLVFYSITIVSTAFTGIYPYDISFFDGRFHISKTDYYRYHYRYIGVQPPSDLPPNVEKILLYLQNTTNGDETLLFLNINIWDFWDVINFMLAYNTLTFDRLNYTVYLVEDYSNPLNSSIGKFKENNWIVWRFPETLRSNINVIDIIKKKSADFIILYNNYPPEKEEEVRRKMKLLNDNYTLIKRFTEYPIIIEIYKVKNS